MVPCFGVWWRVIDARLLCDLTDRVRLRLLSAVRVLRTGVHLELPDQPAAELVLREHSPDGEFDGLTRIPVEQLSVRDRFQTAGPAGVPGSELVGALVSGERDLGRVHDNDEVSAVHMWRKRRLVLAAQQGCRRDREPS